MVPNDCLHFWHLREDGEVECCRCGVVLHIEYDGAHGKPWVIEEVSDGV
jgi:hypothetical protein